MKGTDRSPTDGAYPRREAQMQISIMKNGGFAGISERLSSVDTKSLDADLERSVSELIRGMDFFSLPERVGAETIGADLFWYEVTITDGTLTRSVAFGEEKTPENAPLHALLRALVRG
jgi:hypothetical protein